MSDLIIIENFKPEEIFTPEGIKSVVDIVKEKVKDFVPDMTTKKGQKEIASLARKVSSSKALIESAGKDYVSAIKAKIAPIDSARKYAREELDKLRDEIKRPLDDFRKAEEIRVEILEQLLEDIQICSMISNIDGTPKIKSQVLLNLGDLEAFKKRTDYDEYAHKAFELIEAGTNVLNNRLEELTLAEERQAELDELRKKQAERDKKDYEEKIRKEAEEKARQEEKEKAKREEEEREQARIRREEMKAEEERKRKQDIEHRRTINRAAVESFMKELSWASESEIITIVTLIAQGKVENVSIRY
jgi:hypothetical protein